MDSVGNEQMASLFAKKHVTILITDSGLGGLSIFAEIAARLKIDPIFPEITLVYYNAWPEQNRGYNGLKDMDERIRVFDRALAGMKRYQPDIIMIACNTLSVLYNQTAFSRRETLPVIDIVQFGVDLVYETLSREADGTAAMLGTVTTIASGVHRSRLIQKGIAPDRLISQPCDQLATRIEKGPHSDAVVQLVDLFMEQAAEKLGPRQPNVFAALFCTHFSYCRSLIKEKLETRTRSSVTILDPNQHMAAFLFEACGDNRHGHAVVNMQVVSRIIWEQAKINAISGIVEAQSAETAQALKNYEHKSDLFTY